MAQLGVRCRARSFYGATQLGLWSNTSHLAAGLVNMAGRLRGVQLGLVNFSGRGGLPFSVLFNVGW